MYVTEEDYEEQFGRAELDDLLSGGADFEKIELAAASLVGGYIASRYRLPLVTVPDLVRGWVLDIVRHKLWSDRAPEEIRQRYDDAIGQLRDVSRGIIALPLDAAGAVAPTPLTYGTTESERVFTRDTLADY